MLYAIVKSIAVGLMRLLFRVEARGLENLPVAGPVLLVSNHSSVLDPPLVGGAAPLRLSFLAKAELFRLPVFGGLLRRLGARPVRREGPDPAAMRMALRVLEEVLKTRGLEPNGKVAARVIPTLRDRIHVSDDIRTLAEGGELDYYFRDPELDEKKVPGKGSDPQIATRHLAELRKRFAAHASSEEMTSERAKELVWEYAEKEGRGPVLWPLRYALTGAEHSPDPFTVASIIGGDACVRRIDAALTALGA